MVASHDVIRIVHRNRYASRGGEKLEGALLEFALDVSGWLALDVGASTGGFTDCLLQAGVAEVTAVDVGNTQLDPKLVADARVNVADHTNARDLKELVQGPFDLVVADLSFISLTKVVGALASVLRADGGVLLLLIKPQFESTASEATKGRGVISDPEVWERVILEVAQSCVDEGFGNLRLAPSQLRGRKGNTEFFLAAERSTEPVGNGSNLRQLALEAVERALASR